METHALSHYGVIGMKWGVRKDRAVGSLKSKVATAQEKRAFEKKRATAVSKRDAWKSNSEDIKYAKYLKQPVGARVAKSIAYKTVGDVFLGSLLGTGADYSKFTAKDWGTTLAKNAPSALAETAFNTALAKSAMKNYDVNGRTITKGRNDKIFTKEEVIKQTVTTAATAAKLGLALGSVKLNSVAKNARQNRETFEKWGGNILPEKISNLNVWNDGEDYAVYERAH